MCQVHSLQYPPCSLPLIHAEDKGRKGGGETQTRQAEKEREGERDTGTDKGRKGGRGGWTQGQTRGGREGGGVGVGYRNRQGEGGREGERDWVLHTLATGIDLQRKRLELRWVSVSSVR